MHLAALRTLDANLNRAAEGLRTQEDIARFALNNASLSASFKRLRHALHSAFDAAISLELLAARDTEHDVGTEIKTSTETTRTSLLDIASAAAGRIEQSLRCISEILKLESSQSAKNVESIRYEVYDLNAQLRLKLCRDQEFLTNARLYVLVDCRMDEPAFIERAVSLSKAGVALLQIRDKDAEAGKVIRYTKSLLSELDPAKTRVIVNDRADVACAVGAAGLHIGQDDIPVDVARKLLPPNSWLGLSTHDVYQLEQSMQLDVDYIGCGPTFPSSTKSFGAFAGLDYLRTVAESGSVPAFAIGGITLENVHLVVASGVRRVAVSHAVWQANDPFDAAARFLEKLNR